MFYNEFEETRLDDSFDEAEKRISLASYYKQLVKGGIFNDGTEEAAIIDAEIRDFAHKRMKELLGMAVGESKTSYGFTEIEINTLKQIANRVIERQVQPVSEPVVNTLASPVLKTKVEPKSIPYTTSSIKPKPYKEIVTINKNKKIGKQKKIKEEIIANGPSNIKATPQSIPMPSREQLQQIVAGQAMTTVSTFVDDKLGILGKK